MPSYCVRQRKHTEDRNPHLMSGGKTPRMVSTCAECGAKKCRFVSRGGKVGDRVPMAQQGQGFYGGLAKTVAKAAAEEVAKQATPRLVDWGLKKIGAGVKRRGRGLTRAGGGLARPGWGKGGSLKAKYVQKWARPGKLPVASDLSAPRVPFIGRGVLDDEISTDLHLKRRGK